MCICNNVKYHYSESLASEVVLKLSKCGQWHAIISLLSYYATLLPTCRTKGKLYLVILLDVDFNVDATVI